MSKKKKPKKIRGLDPKKYAYYMHKIERGETTEKALVRKGILKKSARSRGIAKNRDAILFSNRRKERGKGSGKTECLYPKCKNRPSRRGLCNTHRIEARRYIREGKTTETNLINRKLLLPKARGGSSSKSKNKKAKKRASFPKKLLESTVCLHPKCKIVRKGGSRGLCMKHYSQYKRKREKLSDQKRKALNKDLINRRLLLPAKKVKKLKKAKKTRRIKRRSLPESSAFDLGSSIRGSIRY
jgi:hypothetical protein